MTDHPTKQETVPAEREIVPGDKQGTYFVQRRSFSMEEFLGEKSEDYYQASWGIAKKVGQEVAGIAEAMGAPAEQVQELHDYYARGMRVKAYVSKDEASVTCIVTATSQRRADYYKMAIEEQKVKEAALAKKHTDIARMSREALGELSFAQGSQVDSMAPMVGRARNVMPSCSSSNRCDAKSSQPNCVAEDRNGGRRQYRSTPKRGVRASVCAPAG